MICEWCGEPFEATGTRGPGPKYCRQSHRQRAYEHRNRLFKAITLLRDEGYTMIEP